MSNLYIEIKPDTSVSAGRDRWSITSNVPSLWPGGVLAEDDMDQEVAHIAAHYAWAALGGAGIEVRLIGCDCGGSNL